MIHNLFSIPVMMVEIEQNVFEELRSNLKPHYNKLDDTDFFLKENKQYGLPDSFLQFSIEQANHMINTSYFGKNVDSVKEYWMQRYDRDLNNSDINQMHTHPYTCISAVVWLEADPEASDLVLVEPNPIVYHNHNPRKVNVKPEQGKMIFFPSFVPHYVEKNARETKRVVLALNF